MTNTTTNTATLPTRNLGDLTVSAIGLGCMGMSAFYGPSDHAENLSVLHHAIERGVTFWDTADMYGLGHNEELLSGVLQSHRDKIMLATKFGNIRTPEGGWRVLGTPEYVKSACEASLKRLRVDTIDLYYQHRVDPDVPIEDTVGAMAELVKEGKVRFLGLSEAGVQTIRRAHATHPITALQTEYSLWSRDPEAEILPTCRELGIGFVPYSPLGRGFLTGQIKSPDDFAPDDFRRSNPRFQGENFQKNLDMVARITQIARDKNVTTGQIALAWVIAKGNDVVPIPGTRRIKYLDENTDAVNITLTPDDLRRLNEAAPVGAAQGTRYPEAMMARVGV